MTDPIRDALERAARELERAGDELMMADCLNLGKRAKNEAHAVRAALVAPTPPADPDALAARPLLEAVAQMGDCIGQHTVGQIMALSNRAASWLNENPPGQPVAIEPRGCPIPGACSCVQPAAPTPPADGETGPSEEEWDALVERVWDAHQTIGHQSERFMWDSHFDRAAVMLRDELARWGRLATPTPPVDQKTRELVAAIRAAYSAYGWVSEDQFNRLFDEVVRLADVIEEGCDCSVQGPLDWQREIEKLKSQANPPSANGEAEELAQWLDGEAKSCAAQFHDRITRAAALLRQPAPAPVPVAERPWERPGWCDAEGRCWWGRCADDFFNPEWTMATLADIEEFCSDAMPQHCLPHWAIPIPTEPTTPTETPNG